MRSQFVEYFHWYLPELPVRWCAELPLAHACLDRDVRRLLPAAAKRQKHRHQVAGKLRFGLGKRLLGLGKRALRFQHDLEAFASGLVAQTGDPRRLGAVLAGAAQGPRGGVSPAPGGAEPGRPSAPQRPGQRIPPWVFPLGMLVALEPPALIALWAVNRDLAEGDLLAIALVGGFFVSLPSLAIAGLAVLWDRRLADGRPVPGLPPALTGGTASRVSAIALVASTIVLGGGLALLLGQWALLALPPLALSLASAWLMARSA